MLSFEEVADESFGGLLDQLSQGASLDYPAGAHERDLITQVGRLGHIMSDDDDSLSQGPENALELLLHAVAHDGIQGPHRLVHQQDLRIEHERSHDANPLALPSAELGGETGQQVRGEVDESRQLFHAGLHPIRAPALLPGHKRDILGRRQVREETTVLDDVPHSQADLAHGLRSEHRPVESDLAAVGMDQPDDQSQQSRFSASAGPDQSQALALLDRHRGGLQHSATTINLAHALEGDHPSTFGSFSRSPGRVMVLGHFIVAANARVRSWNGAGTAFTIWQNRENATWSGRGLGQGVGGMPSKLQSVSEQVQISRGLLTGLGTLLVASLLAVGFLVGQRSAPGQTGQTPSATASSSPLATGPPMAAAARPEDQSIEDRLDTLEKRIESRQRQVGSLRVEPSPLPLSVKSTPSPASSPFRSQRTEKVLYLEHLDEIVGRSAFTSSQSFSERLLPQAMAGAEPQLEELLARTSHVREEVRALRPPPECLAHQALVVEQLDEAVRLLEEVRAANASGDAKSLQALASRVASSQEQTAKLQALDRTLRQIP